MQLITQECHVFLTSNRSSREKKNRQIRDIIMYISIINIRKDNTIFVCLNKFNTQHNDAGRAVHLQQWNKK